MAEEEVSSLAFEQARLQTERLRIYGVLAFVGLLLVVTALRTLVLHTGGTIRLWETDLGVVLLLMVYELAMLRWVRRALDSKGRLPTAAWGTGLAFEALLPAFWMALLSSAAIEPVYQPLANPATLVFFVFIILSILRLSPRVCQIAGAVAAAGYLAASWYLGWRPPDIGSRSPVTTTMVSVYAITLLAAGFLAGLVAREVRKNVEAALREAETQQRLQQVKHDLEVARSIQQSLLPSQRPNLEGFDIAGWNRPADDTGGDYFDWLKILDGRWAIMLADVTGHGIGPALLAASSRAYARASFETQPDIVAAFQHMNQAMAGDLDPRRFVTFAAAECRPGSGDVQLFSAGHAPLYLFSASENRFWEMEAHATPLGILPVLAGDPPSTIAMKSGDLILLVTDGFFEWENASGEQFGSERVEKAVRGSQGMASEKIIERLYADVLAFAAGTSQKDDLTAVVIRRV
jgi:serine phosphatase RsbU (regulator of sigma subunit)